MNTNVGKFDRLARLLGAVILAVLVYTGVFVGALAMAVLFVAVVLFITALVGICPTHGLLGLNTRGARR